MCGITGFSFPAYTAPLASWLEDSVRSLSHRGPDDSDLFLSSDGSLGLGHVRLSIIELSSAAHQPMLSPSGDVALVFNGEIYNYKDLRLHLSKRGFYFQGSSDTEVLLALYLSIRDSAVARPGVSVISTMLRQLEGIFSFAIWDHSFDSLLLVRDALGVKPLYIRQHCDGISFSSEIKSLPLDGLSVNPEALNHYLTYLWCPGDATPAEGISKLPPGSASWVTRGVMDPPFQWYSLPLSGNHYSRTKIISPSQSISGVQCRLRDAVHRQLVSDVPVGAFLSGGLDSSSVVAFAREIIPDLPCFTIEATGGNDDSLTNDLPYARLAASHLGLPLEVVKVEASQMAASLEDMVWQLDEPLADPAPLNVLFISRLARQQGIKVLLSGSGGDDLFTGYRRHYALHNERLWSWLPRHVRKQLRWLTHQMPVGHPFLRRLRKAFSGAHLDGDERIVNYFRWIDRSDLYSLYTKDFRDALSSSNDMDPMLAFLEDLPQSIPPLERMLLLEQRFFLSDHNLIYTDKMSMASGVEVRVPFLDLDLVDFASRIPLAYKQRGREGKWVLKKAMESYLPHSVIYRPKCGFGAPLRDWMRYELRDWLSDILSPTRLQSRGIFDPLSVQRLIEDNADGTIDASYTLLSLACIEIWCKNFIDASNSRSTGLAEF